MIKRGTKPDIVVVGSSNTEENRLKEFSPLISGPGPSPFFSPRVMAALAFGLVVFALAAVVFGRYDLSLSDGAQGIPGANNDHSFWWLVNYYGELPTWAMIGLAVLALGLSWTETFRQKLGAFRPHLVYLLATAALAPGLIGQGVKAIINRPRPGDGLGFFPLFAFGPGGHDNSFPSGHTAMAFVLFALVFLIPRANRRLRVLAGAGFFLWGVAVGISRVVWGAHYPSDALFGAGISLAVEIVLWAAVFRRRVAAAGPPQP